MPALLLILPLRHHPLRLLAKGPRYWYKFSLKEWSLMGRECYTISVSKHIKPCHVTPCHAIPDITTYLIITISTKFKFTDHADSKYRTVRINESQDYCPSWAVCEKYQKRNGLVFWSTMYIYVSWQWRVAHWVYVIHTYTNLIPAFPRSVAPPLPSATVNNC